MKSRDTRVNRAATGWRASESRRSRRRARRETSIDSRQ